MSLRNEYFLYRGFFYFFINIFRIKKLLVNVDFLSSKYVFEVASAINNLYVVLYEIYFKFNFYSKMLKVPKQIDYR